MNAVANLSLSKNKVINFTEYIDDYDNGGQKINHYSSTDIALSPAIVGGASVNFLPTEKLELSLLNKYVSKQFLDNTQNNGRKLNAFFVQGIKAVYTINKIPKIIRLPKEINLIAQVNNVFNRKYEPNGYTYSYIYGGVLSVNNYYFPMAGTNFMLGVNVSL
jgi:iron complex outermembrane receptor protein